jgi:hypothetical protein
MCITLQRGKTENGHSGNLADASFTVTLPSVPVTTILPTMGNESWNKEDGVERSLGNLTNTFPTWTLPLAALATAEIRRRKR